MSDNRSENCGCRGDRDPSVGEGTAFEARTETTEPDGTEIMGEEMSLLVAAGASLAANSEAHLNEVVADLKETAVPEEHIRAAMQVGQAVKDKPAMRLKEVADFLTGSRLADDPSNKPCPMESMPRDESYKVTMLIAAGSAMAAGCEPCLNQAIPGLIEAGVADADIRRAVEIGQAVKEIAADNMKEVADVLAGTALSDGCEPRRSLDESTLQPVGCC
jgi:alkylhydroperoxidase/carboxymuconolactone decarboxylase family protein YurZ